MKNFLLVQLLTILHEMGITNQIEIEDDNTRGVLFTKLHADLPHNDIFFEVNNEFSEFPYQKLSILQYIELPESYGFNTVEELIFEADNLQRVAYNLLCIIASGKYAPIIVKE
jgi:hypothetical protein